MPKPAPSFIPHGMHTITPHLWFNGDCQKAIQFYQRAFDAEEVSLVYSEDKPQTVMHAMLKIGDSYLMMADAWPDTSEQGPVKTTSVGIWLYVEDCDALFKQAVGQGCKVVMPLMDAFWGDRFAKVRDPFGHCWAIATYKLLMNEEEIKQAKEKWMQENKVDYC
ncbi:MAG: VOC family protein [Myxococcales bacterium]|nr:VOC family protein [Myxococcales bacterium]USN50227.1 MAG: VOC family protein [Myxococcales bacterium]